MDLHPTPFPGTKTHAVRSKYKKIGEAPKQKPKEPPPLQRQRRTFGTIRNPNVPTKTVPEKPKTKTSNPISQKQPKTESESATDSAKKSPENGSNNRANPKKKKSVCFLEKLGGSATKNSPAKDVDGVQTPVRPPFSAKPVRIPGTPYLSAEKCSSCRFDRLETSSYWLGQIKSAETVGKHFVAAAFFRLAHDCKAEPTQNLRSELKRYLIRHEHLSTEIEWKEVSRRYGILKEGSEINDNEGKINLVSGEMDPENDSKLVDIGDDHEQKEHENDQVKEIYEQ